MAKSASRNAYTTMVQRRAEDRQNVVSRNCGQRRPAPCPLLRRGARAEPISQKSCPAIEEENEVGGKLEQRFPRGDGIHCEAPGELDHPEEEEATGRQVERRPENRQTPLPRAGNRPEKQRRNARTAIAPQAHSCTAPKANGAASKAATSELRAKADDGGCDVRFAMMAEWRGRTELSTVSGDPILLCAVDKEMNVVQFSAACRRLCRSARTETASSQKLPEMSMGKVRLRGRQTETRTA